MQDIKFDLQKFAEWGVDQALAAGEKKIGIPLGEIAGPMAKEAMKSLSLAPLEIDPVMMMMGRLVLAGMDRQRKIDQARRVPNDNGSG